MIACSIAPQREYPTFLLYHRQPCQWRRGRWTWPVTPVAPFSLDIGWRMRFVLISPATWHSPTTAGCCLLPVWRKETAGNICVKLATPSARVEPHTRWMFHVWNQQSTFNFLSKWYLAFNVYFSLCSVCFCPVDGPEDIKIAGPAQIQVGQSVMLNCSAESKPLASYKWTLNEIEFSNSSEISFVVQHSSNGSNYTCQAVNSVTGRTISAVHTVSVTEKSMLLIL